MFDFPVDGGSRWVLYGLLIVWAALLVFGFILGKPDPDKRRRLPLGARMGMSVALVIAAFVWWRAGTAGTSLGRLRSVRLLGYGQRLPGRSLYGWVDCPETQECDLWHPVLRNRPCFLYPGLCAGCRSTRSGSRPGRTVTLAVYLAVAVILWLVFVRSPARGRTMNFGTLGYSLLLSAMGATAMALALQNGAFHPAGHRRPVLHRLRPDPGQPDHARQPAFGRLAT